MRWGGRYWITCRPIMAPRTFLDHLPGSQGKQGRPTWRFYMSTEQPIFTIIERDSNKQYHIWADGRISGFPEDSIIVNGIWPLICSEQALRRKLGIKPSSTFDLQREVPTL